VTGLIDPAWIEVVDRATSTFQPNENAALSGVELLELHGPTGLLLDHDGPRPNPTADHEVADLHLDDVASPQLAVDREIEHSPISKSQVLIESEPNGPDLLWLQRAFGTELPASVPGPSLGSRIKF
jgi:hypothetical protein